MGNFFTWQLLTKISQYRFLRDSFKAPLQLHNFIDYRQSRTQNIGTSLCFTCLDPAALQAEPVYACFSLVYKLVFYLFCCHPLPYNCLSPLLHKYSVEKQHITLGATVLKVSVHSKVNASISKQTTSMWT